MTRVFTERIYTLAPDGSIATRPGQIRLDAAEMLSEPEDTLRPLHVEALRVQDIAVNIGYTFLDRYTSEIVTHGIGYLVTSYEDGTGVITPGELIDHDPRTWDSDHLLDQVARIDPDEFAEFTLHNLARYAQTQRAFRQRGPLPNPILPRSGLVDASHNSNQLPHWVMPFDPCGPV